MIVVINKNFFLSVATTLRRRLKKYKIEFEILLILISNISTKIKNMLSSIVLTKSRLARERRAEDMRQREVDRLRRVAEIKKIEEEEEIEGEVILLTAGGLR